jgi:squalene cyclase
MIAFLIALLTWAQQSDASEAYALAWPRLYPATCVQQQCSARVHSVPLGKRVYIIEVWPGGIEQRYHVAGERLSLPLVGQ